MNLFWTILFVTLSSSEFLFGEISSDLNAMAACAAPGEREPFHSHAWNLETFEAQIAYFFGVPDPQPVKEAYMNALKQIEEIGSHSTDMLQKEVSPYLEEAYQSIAKQRNWSFDIHLAAQIELEIILGNINGASFEKISDLMVQLYTLVFQSNSPKILKAAWLRTFLYQYKVEIIEKEGQIYQQDYNLMLNMAKTSEEFLNSIK